MVEAVLWWRQCYDGGSVMVEAVCDGGGSVMVEAVL